MCGIAGKVYFRNKKEVHLHELKLMSDKIAHRGPDDEGFYLSENKSVGLVSTRLAIVDLSQNGHMPMTYLDRYVITFNGEIYNFKERRKELEQQGYKFNSGTDTEVILALYSKYKKGCLNHLRGMFAFAIYDSVEETLFLTRDRIGKKPLKYYLTEDCLVFASELKSIITQTGIKRLVDYEAINLYLNYGYCPSPYTGFQNIKKLEPGNYLFINLKNKNVEKKRYWEPRFDKKLHLSEDQWCKKILDTLDEATKIRMVADVPVGAFLSGGADSSAVVATMARLSTKPIKTFTITFKDKELNEGPYAFNIAKKYKTEHHVLEIKPQSTEILPFLARQYEEPFSDASCIPTYIVSEMTKKYVTVALNGDGGDENFAGYPNRYMRLQRDVDYDFWIQNIRPAAAEALKVLSKVSTARAVTKAKNFFEKAKLPLYRRFASYNKMFGPDEILNHSHGRLHDIATRDQAYEIINSCFNMFKGKDLKDAGLKFDLLYFLPDLLLTKVDIAAMAVSLETRSPFLDQKMIELAGKIPFHLKVKNNEPKYILKKALEKIVPKENLYRPKMGFTIPLNKWFSGELNDYASKLLLSKNSAIKNFFDHEHIKNMILSNNKDSDFGPRVWALMSLELWLQNYF